MKYIDDHDAIHKKSNKDAGITDGEDEEMVDAEPVDSKSELTLVQVAISVHIVECNIGTPHLPFCMWCWFFFCFHSSLSVAHVCCKRLGDFEKQNMNYSTSIYFEVQVYKWQPLRLHFYLNHIYFCSY